MENNQLSGQVPTTLGKNAALNQVNLSQNNLEGNLDFSSALSKSGQLQELLIQENSFTGVLFGLMGNLTSRLNIFVAHDNKLIGGLPKTIANISSLEWIDLSNNLFNEPIPESIAMVEQLVWIDLSRNDMLGPIPTQMGMLRNHICFGTTPLNTSTDEISSYPFIIKGRMVLLESTSPEAYVFVALSFFLYFY